MSLGDCLLRSLLLPGFLSALLVGSLLRGLAAWLGAVINRRSPPPPWQPLEEIVHLAGKSRPGGGPQAWAAGPALVALVALSWALGMLPWPPQRPAEELPVDLIIYLLLLTAPPLARLVGGRLAAWAPAALGLRRQAPLEVARLLPVLLAGIALPLFSGQFTLAPAVAVGPWSALVGLAAAAILLVALPWPMWDRDLGDGPLAGLSGRPLALFRALESLELAAHLGLVAVALRASGLFPAGRAGWALLLAVAAGLAALTVWEARGRQPLLPEAARWYTRLLLPVAVVHAFIAWWFGG